MNVIRQRLPQHLNDIFLRLSSLLERFGGDRADVSPGTSGRIKSKNSIQRYEFISFVFLFFLSDISLEELNEKSIMNDNNKRGCIHEVSHTRG